jgi:hypothetical protein
MIYFVTFPGVGFGIERKKYIFDDENLTEVNNVILQVVRTCATQRYASQCQNLPRSNPLSHREAVFYLGHMENTLLKERPI